MSGWDTGLGFAITEFFISSYTQGEITQHENWIILVSSSHGRILELVVIGCEGFTPEATKDNRM
jgi:hypothetical protein